MRSIELFAGAGGLALGTEAAGFSHAAVIEWDNHACETIKANQMRGFKPVSNWPLQHLDVRNFDFKPHAGKIDLISGGPPCQPFSQGGKHKGPKDAKNMLPEVVRAARETQPAAVLIENVKGLLRAKFARFFEYLILQLTFPDEPQRNKETWKDHLAHLERMQTRGTFQGLRYNVVFTCLNAADFGVPQHRERVFIVGIRGDLGVGYSFPHATHSQGSLIWDQFISGKYWERYQIKKEPNIKPPAKGKLNILLKEGRPNTLPWATVRDAIGDLPNQRQKNLKFFNHEFHDGARTYVGHTGSLLDLPSKTLKAGSHGVPGGENMIAYPDGKVRYFTVRECARLQTFPDDYHFFGSWTENMRQLGNAVPITLANVVASSIKKQLNWSGNPNDKRDSF